jgi:hypothetical protein
MTGVPPENTPTANGRTRQKKGKANTLITFAGPIVPVGEKERASDEVGGTVSVEDTQMEEARPRGSPNISQVNLVAIAKLLGDVSSPETFMAAEKSIWSIFRKAKAVKCPACADGQINSKGVGGDANQFLVRLLQVRCTACTKSFRVGDVFRHSGLEAQAEQLRVAMTKLKPGVASGSKKRKISIPARSGSKNTPVEGESDSDLPVLDSEDEAGASVEKTGGSEMDQLRFENAMLRRQIQDLSAQLAEALRGQQEVLAEFRALRDRLEPASQEADEVEAAEAPAAPPAIAPAPRRNDQGRRAAVAAPQKPAKRAYADVVGKPAKASLSKSGLKKLASKLIRKVPSPEMATDFCKIHLRLPGNRAMARCPYKQKNALVQAMLRELGIKSRCSLFSLIGNSKLELYIPVQHQQEVFAALEKAELEYTEDVDVLFVPAYAKVKDVVERVVDRVSFLMLRATTVKLRAKILEGIPEAIQDRIRANANRSRGGKGRAGRQERPAAAGERGARAEQAAVPAVEAAAPIVDDAFIFRPDAEEERQGWGDLALNDQGVEDARAEDEIDPSQDLLMDSIEDTVPEQWDQELFATPQDLAEGARVTGNAQTEIHVEDVVMQDAGAEASANA